MSEIGYERQPITSTRPWKIYTSSSWKTTSSSSSSSSSMNAVSFGFVATAILISLFLIMAILEHIFRPMAPPPPPATAASSGANLDPSASKFRVHHQNETATYRGGVSVLMPGDKYPTCIAKPAPLPCPRQGLHWPSYHQHNFAFP